MPHEVIMPALGMAQDEGIIVAWLKAPGDAVKAGDALMEVETDKATMEVEASHDGFLSDVRAAEGEAVPVGQTVAVIADTADAAHAASPAKANGASAPEPSAAPEPGAATEPEDSGVPEGHQVIMPALGMAQDSGVVVSWLKAAGDAVAEGDALLEVETDKATMEVEADRAGYLGAILADDGDDVPVGQVIAVITAERPETPVRRALADAPAAASASTAEAPAAAPEPKAQPEASAAAANDTADRGRPAPQPVSRAGTAKITGPILASPKAKRLAAEAGLDLADLAAAGYPQPYHAADIETLRTLPKAAPAQAPAAAAAPATLTAEAPAEPLDAFLAWASEDKAAPAGPRLLAAFVAGALRAAEAREGPLTVSAAALGPQEAWDDPDLAPLAAQLDPSGGAPALAVRDLSATPLTGRTPGTAQTPALTLTRRGDTLTLTLAYDPAALPEEVALALIAGTAERLSEPLRHLL